MVTEEVTGQSSSAIGCRHRDRSGGDAIEGAPAAGRVERVALGGRGAEHRGVERGAPARPEVRRARSATTPNRSCRPPAVRRCSSQGDTMAPGDGARRTILPSRALRRNSESMVATHQRRRCQPRRPGCGRTPTGPAPADVPAAGIEPEDVAALGLRHQRARRPARAAPLTGAGRRPPQPAAGLARRVRRPCPRGARWPRRPCRPATSTPPPMMSAQPGRPAHLPAGQIDRVHLPVDAAGVDGLAGDHDPAGVAAAGLARPDLRRRGAARGLRRRARRARPGQGRSPR